jgi:ParB-like chromosome segregation protein Spo0J
MKMKITDIVQRPPFNTIFPTSEKVLVNVTMDMRSHGFDPCHAVILWRGKNVVVDGNTRIEAAKLAGLLEVDVQEHDFTDEDDAFVYAVRCQRERRNLTDADIARLVDEVDARRERGGDHTSEKAKAKSQAIDPPGKSADTTAAIVGTSRDKVEKLRAIKARSPEILEDVKSGKIKTINRAYQKTKKPKESGPFGLKGSYTMDQYREAREKARAVKQRASAEPPLSGLTSLTILMRTWEKAFKPEREQFLTWAHRQVVNDLPKLQGYQGRRLLKAEGQLCDLFNLLPRIPFEDGTAVRNSLRNLLAELQQPAEKKSNP